MKRLQIYIEEELDDALAAEAIKTGTSKAALIRGFVADRLGPSPQGDPLDELVGACDGEPATDIDAVIYGT